MLRQLKVALNYYTDQVAKEGREYVEIKALIAFLNVVKTVRKITVTYYISLLSCILVSSGFIALMNQMIHQYQKSRQFTVDGIIIFSIVTATIGLVLSVWILSEKHWLKMFHVDEYIRSISKK